MSSETTIEALIEALNLRQKLHKITGDISSIAKGGKNEKHGYSYVKAEDVVRTIREKFIEHGVLMLVDASNVSHFTDTGGKQFVTEVELEVVLINVDDPEDHMTFQWVGAGADIGGEKGLYKAYTGGVKYFLLNLFMVPTGDDPEGDRTTEPTSNPDTRPAAPVIPIDRAYAILKLAKEGKHAEIPDDGTAPALSAVFRAKLATVGVDKIGDLNVDQAEDVEAWLRTESANAG